MSGESFKDMCLSPEDADKQRLLIEALKAENENLRRPRRVLFVEDDQGVRSIVKYLTKDLNCEITYCDTGEEGLRVALAYPFDIVLLDIKLPEMSGIDVFRELALKPPYDPPVVMFTGLITPEDQQAIKAIGFAAIVLKGDFDVKYFTSMFRTFGVKTKKELGIKDPS